MFIIKLSINQQLYPGTSGSLIEYIEEGGDFMRCLMGRLNSELLNFVSFETRDVMLVQQQHVWCRNLSLLWSNRRVQKDTGNMALLFSMDVISVDEFMVVVWNRILKIRNKVDYRVSCLTPEVSCQEMILFRLVSHSTR